MVVLVNLNCKKERPAAPTATPSLPNTILLNASAGADRLVFLPTNYCQVGGSISFNGTNSFSFGWKKISGPPSFLIEEPNSLGTKVSNLIAGVYSFELTVSARNTTIKDTCTVTVGVIPYNPTEFVFENKDWHNEGLLWGSQIIISNIFQFLPSDRVFRAYIKRDNSTIWKELVDGDNNSPYEAFIMNGNWSVWSNYEELDTPDIKFVY